MAPAAKAFCVALLLALCACAAGRPARQLQQGARPVPAITGGWTAPPNAFGYIAALLDPWKDWAGCSGSLIAPRLVLTAAHCLEDGNPRYVLLRTRNLYDHRAPAEVIRVTRVVVHPKYNLQGLVENDAALLVLAQASKATPVAMAGPKFALNATDKLLVAGWGATSQRNDQSDVLLYASLPFLPRPTCVNLMLSNPKPWGLISDPSELPTSHICAGWGADKQDSCPGDSGGPLVAGTLTKPHVLVGIVSWGLPTCGQGRGLGAYQSVSQLGSWITQTRRAVAV